MIGTPTIWRFHTSPCKSLHQLISVVAALVCSLASVHASVAAELVMVRQIGCSWCVLWDKEIGEKYASTEEGRLAPVRMVMLHDPLPAAVKLPVTITPTFLLLDEGREVGRITGYPGESFFWEMLSDLLSLYSRTEHRAR